ncbi:Monovalent cation/H+ antiporter subunit D family protein [Sulfidibacter corallicola]|uniref:Monovalent cation/H+ antiporter subunit D family protein n=1 Tax=Sulfidibacter corallicola TaxID=2818388 RepID=A0A8A4TL35_SULCO|nr:monovalent cation/H+ antiporter subunit D family protein [Sulfidibacter corallicola]QTD49568.1 monovalent cation/H+ antiporter subunit D family protein [Sulfidibacter corallicola]
MDIVQQAPILMILCPFLGAFAVSLAGLIQRRWCYPLTVLFTAGSAYAGLGTLIQVLRTEGGVIRYRMGGWEPPFGIEFRLDALNAAIALMVVVVALLVAIYSRQTVASETAGKEGHFYTLFLLLTVGVLGISMTGDAFNLYVFLEISSLSSYALIAMGRGRAAFSCFNYIIMGTIGASFYLLGVGYLYIKTGSLNMTDIARILQEHGLYSSNSVRIGFLFILIGVWIKMAFVPLHRWLPNAYTFAPSTTSCLVAPLMTKVSIYVMIRIMFSVFNPEFVFGVGPRSDLVVWLAVIAMMVGSFYALAKNKLKMMLAYLVIAEVGYMVGGAWLANATGLTGAIFHILADGLMTLALFLAAGAIYYKRKSYNIVATKGLFGKMPFTMGAFAIAALSMIGIPPTCGFFSKWYLISGGIEAGHWGFVVGLLTSSMVNAVLFFRILERAYFEKPELPYEPGRQGKNALNFVERKGVDEAPLTMLAPLWAASLGLVLLGVYSGVVIDFISRYVNSVGFQ